MLLGFVHLQLLGALLLQGPVLVGTTQLSACSAYLLRFR